MNQANKNLNQKVYFSKRSSEHVKQAVFNHRGNTKPAENNPIFRTCFIGGLHIRLKEGELLRHVQNIYPDIDIESVKFIPNRKEKNANRGFGFMTLKNEADYKKVLNLSLELKGKKINFRKAKSYNELKTEESKIFEQRIIVKNLPKLADDLALLKVLEQKGWAIERCYVIRDSNTLKSKRIAFVDFADERDLKKCLKSNKKLQMMGCILTVEAFDQNKSKTAPKKPKGSQKPNSEAGLETSQSRDSGENSVSEQEEAQKEIQSSRWIFLYPSTKRFLDEEFSNYGINRGCRNTTKPLVHTKPFDTRRWAH